MEFKEHLEEIDFHKHLQVLQRRWLPATGVFSLMVASATAGAILIKPTYKAEGTLLIQSNHASLLAGFGEAMGRLESLAIANNPTETQTKIVDSVPVIQETINSLNLKADDGTPLPIDDFRQKLKVEGLKGADVVQVSYKDKDPELAAKVVNRLIDVYIKNNIQANRLEAVTVRKFIMQQLPGTEAAVRNAEAVLRKFKEENNIIVLQEEAIAAVKNVAELDGEISKSSAQLNDLKAQSEKLAQTTKINSSQKLTDAQISQLPGISTALTQLQEAQNQLAVDKTRFLANHPTIESSQQKVAALQRLVQQRVQEITGSNQPVAVGNLQIGELREKLVTDQVQADAQSTGLSKQIATLSSVREQYKQRAKVLPKLEATQRELERKLKAAETTYETLLTKLQEINVTENQNIGNARVISPALVPDKPDGLRKAILIGAGAVVGILAGLIAAFALDVIDGSVKTVKEARELFKYTLLGVIPSFSSKNGNSHPGTEQPIPRVVGRDIPQFPLGDGYQMLQANLKFLSSDRQLKSIVVTSSVAKEGKSEVAVNLAIAMAQLGHRVLLVDGDMRDPVQHHIWGVMNGIGLSNVIVDQVPLEVAVQPTIPNLDVLTSGVVPPSPVALLDSQRMQSLVHCFSQQYDYVIYDTPALAGTADAAVLGKLADGVLLVVRPGLVDIASANAAKEYLAQSNQNVLGMVINCVNAKREPDSYFYYTRETVPGVNSQRTVAIANRLEQVVDEDGKRP